MKEQKQNVMRIVLLHLVCVSSQHTVTSRAWSTKDTASAAADGGESKSALMHKSLTDKRWAEKQAAGFTTWLNFTMGSAEKPLKGRGSADSGEDDDVGGGGGGGGVSSSPLKAMVVMVSEFIDV